MRIKMPPDTAQMVTAAVETSLRAARRADAVVLPPAEPFDPTQPLETYRDEDGWPCMARWYEIPELRRRLNVLRLLGNKNLRTSEENEEYQQIKAELQRRESEARREKLLAKYRPKENEK